MGFGEVTLLIAVVAAPVVGLLLVARRLSGGRHKGEEVRPSRPGSGTGSATRSGTQSDAGEAPKRAGGRRGS